MIAYTRDEIISATDLARNVSGTLSSLTNEDKEKIAIMKNNKLEAVMMNIEKYEKLKEVYELMEKQFEENMQKYYEEVLKYTYPIYKNNNNSSSKPELIGSSIIICLDEEFYLVTAAHVMRDTGSSFAVGVNKEIHSKNWELNYSTPDKNGKDDFDIGFIKLDKYWIELNEVTAFHVNDNSIASDNVERYIGLLYGFPATSNMNSEKKSWRKDPNKYRLKPYRYTNTILPNKQDGSIVMDYGKNKNNEKPKKLNGMSGCGMWACYIATDKLELVGIFFEHHQRQVDNKEDALYATPIQEVIEFIRKHRN